VQPVHGRAETFDDARCGVVVIVGGLPVYCTDCGEKLKPTNPTDLCAECRWYRRDSQLRAAQREAERARRRHAVRQRIAEIDDQL
jgi:hypothetical protein